MNLQAIMRFRVFPLIKIVGVPPLSLGFWEIVCVFLVGIFFLISRGAKERLSFCVKN
jgi:hypothetical protein